MQFISIEKILSLVTGFNALFLKLLSYTSVDMT